MPRSRTAAAFALLALLWGGSFVAIKVGLGALPPLFFAATRFDIGAVALVCALVLVGDDDLRPSGAGDRDAILAGGVLIVALNNGLLFLGQRYVSPGVGAIVYALNPVLTPVFAWLLLDQRLTPADAAGFLLALVGVGLVARPSPGDLSGATAGAALLLGAAATVALGGVVAERIESRRSSRVITAWSMVLGALLLHAASLARGESLAGVRPTATTVAAMLYTGVLATGLAYPIYFALIGRIGSVEANLIAYVVPIVASLAGWLLLDEAITPPAAVGFLVIVAGFALIEREALAKRLADLRGAPAGE